MIWLWNSQCLRLGNKIQTLGHFGRLSSLHTLFLQSPWSMLGLPIPCSINVFAFQMLTAWNRLVPIAIAAFRYIMVVHAVFVHNHGGERMVSWFPESFLCLSLSLSFARSLNASVLYYLKRCGGFWSPYCQAGVLHCAPWWSATLTASRPTCSVLADKKSSGLSHNFAQHDILDPGSWCTSPIFLLFRSCS